MPTEACDRLETTDKVMVTITYQRSNIFAVIKIWP